MNIFQRSQREAIPTINNHQSSIINHQSTIINPKRPEGSKPKTIKN